MTSQTIEGFYGVDHKYYMSRVAFGLQFKSGQNTPTGLSLNSQLAAHATVNFTVNLRAGAGAIQTSNTVAYPVHLCTTTEL
jgi:hypothetical protein